MICVIVAVVIFKQCNQPTKEDIRVKDKWFKEQFLK